MKKILKAKFNRSSIVETYVSGHFGENLWSNAKRNFFKRLNLFSDKFSRIDFTQKGQVKLLSAWPKRANLH